MKELSNGFTPQAPTRRDFLKAAAVMPFACASLPEVHAQMGSDFWDQPRWVWLRLHRSAEQIRVVFWARGQLVEDEYRKLCWFLRDRKANKAMYMDPVLLDILYAKCAWMQYHGIHRPYITTSAARFPETNRATEGAALDSWHMKGKAHDGYFEGVHISSQHEFARWISPGGVGYYPKRNFIHVDSGKFRNWRG